MNNLAIAIVLGGCAGIILGCLGIDYYFMFKVLRQEKRDKKNLFVKRLSGRKDYEIVETIINGKRVYAERKCGYMDSK